MRKLTALIALAALVSIGLAISTPDAEAAKIRMGFPSRNLMSMPIYVAEERGIYKKHGLDVEVIYIRGGSTAIKAMVAKKIDVMINEPLSTMKAMQKGAKLTFVTALAQRASYQLLAKDDIKSLKELKGRAIGVSRPGAISYIMPNIVLRISGLDPAIADYLAIGTSGARRKALIAGKIDAAVMHVESAYQAASRPGIHVLANIPKLLPKYPFFWMSVHNDFLKKNKKDAVNLIKAFIEVNRYVVKNKEATLAVAKKHMKVKPQFLSKGYDTLLDLKSWSQNGGVNKEAFNFVVKVGLDYKQLKKKLSADQFVDTSYQDDALKAMGRVPENLSN